MDLRVNFTDVEPAKGFDPLPAGTYTVKCTGVEVREASENAKNPGAEYLHWEFTVQEGQFTGQKMWDNSHFGPDSLPFTLAFLEASGKFELPITELTADDIVEKVVGADFKVKLNIKNGYNNVQKWMNVNDGVSAEASLMP